MRKVLHKVKSQWVVLGVMGATVVSLGTTNVQRVSAAEVDGVMVTDTAEQSGNTTVTDDPITFSTEETTTEEIPYTTAEVAASNLEEGKTETASIVTATSTSEVSAIETKDVTAPIIDVSSISISKMAAKEGETISFSVKITDDADIASASIAYLSPITGQTETIVLSKNEASGVFEGNLTVTEATEIGDWKCSNIYASDIYGNSTSLSNVNSNLSGANFTIKETTLAGETESEMGALSVEASTVPASMGEPADAAEDAAGEIAAVSVAETAQELLQETLAVNLAPGGTISTSVNFDKISYVTDNQTASIGNYANGAPGLQWVQVDLGTAYDVNEIQFWHYYADGRSYRDVVVQLSNDASFGSGVATVFNNDTDGSAGLGVGTNSEYSETSSGKTITFDAVNARYARLYSNGSNVNGWNHYIEIKVYGTEKQAAPTVNLAPESTLSSSVNFDRISYVTDNQAANPGNYANGAPGLQWVQMDLGDAYDLNEIQLWHYYADGRTYRDVVVQLSNDASFADGVATVFNNDKDGSAGLGVGMDNEYSETSAGKAITFANTNARYVRLYSNGSNVNGWNHYSEIKVYGSEIQEPPVEKPATTNVAIGATLTTSANFDKGAYIVDGQATTINNYANGMPGLQWVQLDLGEDYDLNAIQLWHYYGDGRSYRDVIVQLSNDATFTEGIVTVFNNDRDGSAGLGVGTDSEYRETSAGKLISFDTVNARYARFYSNGSTGNGWNHYVEIEAYGSKPLKTETRTETMTENARNYTTIEQLDNTLPTGEKELIQTGRNGYDTVTYEVTYTNGIEASRTEISRETTSPVNEIVRIGTKIVETKTETATENIVTFKTVEQQDNTIPTGERKVIQNGSDGYDTVTYEVTYTNGLETNRMETSRQTIQSVDKIVKVGTQVMETKTEIATENVVNASLVEITDSTIPVGERKVIQSGRDGYDKVTYQVTYTNGNETNRTEVSRKTIKVLNEIVVVGTQVVETKTAVITENEVAYIIEEQPDNTLAAGKREVIQTGSNGFDTVTYAITYANGLETGRVKLDSVTTAAVNEVVRVGTQMVEKKAETIKITNGTTPEIIEIADSSLLAGERIVIQTGEGGYDLVTYEVIYTNGAETGRTEIDREAIASVNEFVKVGTKIVETKTETVTENIVGYTTAVQTDDTLPTGQTQYAMIGKNGYDTVSYEVTYINGLAVSRKEINRVTTAPVNEIVKIGTQVIESKTEVLTENESAFTTIELEDDTIPAGARVIIQAGSTGHDVVTYEVTYTNGSPTNYRELNRETIASVNEIIKVGTQVIETKSEVKNENIIGYTTIVEEDATLSADESIVTQTGANGFDAVTYEVTYTNGVETSRVEVSRQTTAPQNQIVKVGTKISVTNITVTSEDADSIILNGSTLQMTASISPDNATATEVTWSIENGTGTATVDSTGLLTAMSAGTVTVKAIANDGSGVVGSQIIEIAVPVSIIGYNGSNLDVVIPELIDGSKTEYIYGYTPAYGSMYYNSFGDFSLLGGLEYGYKGIVTNIDNYAFNGRQLTSVVIPDSVTSIGYLSFYGNQLSSINLPDGLISIGENAFGSNQLTTIDIPNSVVSIGNSAFQANHLIEIVIPSNVISIGASAFSYNQLTSISIPDSITSIESYTFYGNQLTSIEIPSSVTSIGSEAFSNNQLRSVLLSEGLLKIEYSAFYNNQLIEVELPDSLTSIGDNAFFNNQLISVDIPNAVTSIGTGAFYNNQLISVTMAEGLTSIGESAFGSNNGYTYGTNQLTSVTIPSTVTQIGAYAFNNNRLTSVVIPNGVISIAPYAFNGNLLTSVTIPESVTSIGDFAFNSNCLSNVIIPEGVTSIGSNAFGNNQLTNVIIPSTVTKIGAFAFNNNWLTNMNIPEGVTNIGEHAFSGNQLINVVIPKTVKIIGDYAFYYNQLKDVFIPVGVTRIEDYAFGSNQLTKVVLPNSLTSIGNYAFSGNRLTGITIPKSVTIIGTDAFVNNQLISIIIPDSVKVIGSRAFMGNQVSCVTLGAGVQIGENVLTYDNKFREAYKIGGAGTYILTQEGEWTKVEATIGTETAAENMVDYSTVIEEDLSLATDESEIYQVGVAGYDTVTYEVIYSEGVEISRIEISRQTIAPVKQIIKVGNKVEVNNISVTSAEDKSLILKGTTLQMSTAVLPEDANMLSVNWSVENGTGEATIDSNGMLTAMIEGVVTVKATANDGSGVVGSKVIEIAEPLTIISYSGTNLDIVIPEVFDGSQVEYNYGYISGYGYTSYYTYNGFGLLGLLESEEKGIVTSVDYSAFSGKQLTSVVIPDSVTSIGVSAFAGNQLTSVDIPDGVTSIGDGAFARNQLTTIDISDNVTLIGNSAFEENNLTSIIIPDSVISIGAGAFSGNQLTNVTIPDSIAKLEIYAFSNNQLTSITIPNSITSIGDGAFFGNHLTSITIPDGVTSIGGSSFRNNQLTSINIPTGVISIGNSAFQSNQLISIAIPEGITEIGSYAFYDNQLMHVEIPEGVTSIGSYAFSANSYWDSTNGYGNQLTTVIIPSSVTNIGECAFSRNKLTSVVIPEGVTNIGAYAFYSNQLTSAVIPASATSIGDSAFEYNQLTSIVIPEGVIDIGSRAFYGNQLTSVDIPNSVTSIGSYTFYNNQLTDVTIPEGVTNIGAYAFYANQLTSVDIPDSVTTIGNNAFEYNRLSSVEISKAVTSIGTQAFNSNQLTSVVIPEGVISIGNNAFSNNQLSSVEIPNTVSIIGTSAFSNNQLTEIVIPDSVTTIGSYAFQNNQLTSIVIPDSVAFIGNGAFNLNQFTAITIGDDVQVGDNLLGTNNNFRTAYTIGGAGTYNGSQDGEWIKTSI